MITFASFSKQEFHAYHFSRYNRSIVRFIAFALRYLGNTMSDAEKSKKSTHKFDLDLSKREDAIVEQLIEQLKNDRNFSPTVKDGIRLIMDLRDGRFEILFLLFPLIKGDLLEYMANQEILLGMTRMNSREEKLPARKTIVDEQQQLEDKKRELEQKLVEERRALDAKIVEEERKLAEQRREIERKKASEQREINRMLDRLAEERERLQQEREEQQSAVANKLARIEEWIQEQALSPTSSNNENGANHMNPAQGNARKLHVPQFSTPTFDDDDDDDDLIDIREDKSAGKRATQNFLASLQALLDDD